MIAILGRRREMDMRQKTDGMKTKRLDRARLPLRSGDARILVIWTDLRLHYKARTKGDDHGYTVSDP